MENATHLQPDGSGSWEDTWTGTFCQEAPDAHQHTCSQYIAAGYECATMIAEYNCAPRTIRPRQSVLIRFPCQQMTATVHARGNSRRDSVVLIKATVRRQRPFTTHAVCPRIERKPPPVYRSEGAVQHALAEHFIRDGQPFVRSRHPELLKRTSRATNNTRLRTIFPPATAVSFSALKEERAREGASECEHRETQECNN